MYDRCGCAVRCLLFACRFPLLLLLYTRMHTKIQQTLVKNNRSTSFGEREHSTQIILQTITCEWMICPHGIQLRGLCVQSDVRRSLSASLCRCVCLCAGVRTPYNSNIYHCAPLTAFYILCSHNRHRRKSHIVGQPNRTLTNLASIQVDDVGGSVILRPRTCTHAPNASALQRRDDGGGFYRHRCRRLVAVDVDDASMWDSV